MFIFVLTHGIAATFYTLLQACHVRTASTQAWCSGHIYPWSLVRANDQAAEQEAMGDVHLLSQPQYSSYFPHSAKRVAMLSSARRKLDALVN
jgi:hypothetical protein